MKIRDKQGLIVYLYSIKQVKNLKNFGSVTYVSKKMRYAMLYIDQDEKTEETIKNISSQRYVKHVVISKINTLEDKILALNTEESIFKVDLED
ncbi:YlbG family protein [Lentilactobacillus laojiaonis]|uniref:YlbG family protein n=1 Tax=Lentilactobacillus laojiaonis TaxID=2883998 RepID=UPI001D0B09C5|nr:YlbG family protein [Lentilactobacillus laojiaonis]UDM32507.1 YlbG family protein [Lentilactobacillus laojiaonis]